MLNCFKLLFFPHKSIPHSPYWQSKNRIYHSFANLLKRKHWKNDIAQVFIPLTQKLVEALWQQLQPQVFLGMMQQALHICIFFFFLSFFSLDHLRLAGDYHWTAIYRFLQRCLIGSKSQLIESSLSRSCIVLAVCVGWLSCWKVNFQSSLRFWALWTRLSLRISLYLAAFSFPSSLITSPVPAAEKHPRCMMLPPPCFTVGMVLCRW